MFNANIINYNNYVRFVAMVVMVVLWSTVSIQTAFFWSVFIVWLAYEIDYRILGGVSILMLTCTPVLIYLKQEARAEQIAIYVYFLIAMTVALQIIEYWKGEKESEVKELQVLQPEVTNRVAKMTRELTSLPRRSQRVRKIFPKVGSEIRRKRTIKVNE